MENTYQRLEVKVTLCVVHRCLSTGPDTSSRNERRRLRAVQLAIAGVVRRSWRDALAGDGRPNRRSHHNTRGRRSATVRRVRLRGRMVRQRRSSEADGRAGCTLRKGKSRMGPAQKADKELLLGDHLWPGLNGEIPVMPWTANWK